MSDLLSQVSRNGGLVRKRIRVKTEDIFDRAKRKGTTFNEEFDKAVKRTGRMPRIPSYMQRHKVIWRWVRRKISKIR